MTVQDVLKCKTCFAELDPSSAVNGTIKCPYCNNVWTVARKESKPEALEFLRIGEHELDTGRFNEAYEAYRKCAELEDEEPEAYFGMALSEFHVQYIKDEVNNRLQPICHVPTDKKFAGNKNYRLAIGYATDEQQVEYKRRAEEIEYINRKFYEWQQAGVDYDCFLCVKVTGENGEKTQDAKDADYIWQLLTDKGYTPFYSERNIRGQTGADYEAMILHALFTSETMIVVCRDADYLQTPWVKNEYTRFLHMMRDGDKETDAVTVAYGGAVIEQLPGKRGKIQGIDLDKRGSDDLLLQFVDTHTPQHKQKKEAERQAKLEAEQKQKAEQEVLKRKIEEMERRMAAMQTNDSVSTSTQQDKENETGNTQIRQSKTNEPTSLPYQTTAMRIASLQKRILATNQSTPTDFIIKSGCLTKYRGNGGAVVIPDGVTKIKLGAFCESKIITDLIIPASVVEIENEAFRFCSKLNTVIILSNYIRMGELVFWGCKNIHTVFAPASVITCFPKKSLKIIVLTSGVGITRKMFSKFEHLTELVIADSIMSIEEDAFDGCANLASITVEPGNGIYHSVSNCVIHTSTKMLVLGCSNSIIPADGSVTRISNGAFNNCNLGITIPYCVTSVGTKAFEKCVGTVYFSNPALKTQLSKISLEAIQIQADPKQPQPLPPVTPVPSTSPQVSPMPQQSTKNFSSTPQGTRPKFFASIGEQFSKIINTASNITNPAAQANIGTPMPQQKPMNIQQPNNTAALARRANMIHIFGTISLVTSIFCGALSLVSIVLGILAIVQSRSFKKQYPDVFPRTVKQSFVFGIISISVNVLIFILFIIILSQS